MTLTSKINLNTFLLSVAILLLFLPLTVLAQGKQTISISPTIFEASANPEQVINSEGIKIINSNPYELEVYIDVVNFEAQGESGQGKFIPVVESESNGSTIAEWLSVKHETLSIPPEQSVQLPFTVNVPADAAPGGHFAAILVGTKSLSNSEGQMRVETSQVVTSLVFLRVAGDVVEDGFIREFRSTELVSESPKVTFELRFENKGNVHIQPQGDIKILNMWGQERGIIPVNRQTMFGNVLPKSVRKYAFTWSGQWSIADMGRYTAVATLAYGEKNKQFSSSETNFWVIPWKILGVVLTVIAGFFLLVSWAIKLYIRKMLTIAGVSPELHESRRQMYPEKRPRVSVVAPIEVGILDLTHRMRATETWRDKFQAIASFVKHYKIFFAVSVAIILFVIAVTIYIQSASVSERSYEVTIEGLDESVKISSEQVAYDELVKSVQDKHGINIGDSIKEFPLISIVNQSGVSGLAAELKLDLEKRGYQIEYLTNDLDISKSNTVIVYSPELSKEALELSKDVKGALLSAYDGESASEGVPITIYVGQDYENEVQ